MPYTSDEIDRKLKRRFQRRKLTLKDAANFDMNFINRLCETITTGGYYTTDAEREYEEEE